MPEIGQALLELRPAQGRSGSFVFKDPIERQIHELPICHLVHTTHSNISDIVPFHIFTEKSLDVFGLFARKNKNNLFRHPPRPLPGQPEKYTFPDRPQKRPKSFLLFFFFAGGRVSVENSYLKLWFSIHQAASISFSFVREILAIRLPRPEKSSFWHSLPGLYKTTFLSAAGLPEPVTRTKRYE